MDNFQESGWEELMKEACKIEGDLDAKLSSYAKLGSNFTYEGQGDSGSPTIESSRSCKSMEMEIESLLEKLLDTNEAMSRCAASAAPTTTAAQKLARHRDILHEHDFTQISNMSGNTSPRIQLLRERTTIHGNIAHINDVINQAQSTRAVLGSQRTMFVDVQGKVKLLSDKFPILRGLLGPIRRRRSRDTIILSSIIVACTLFLTIYWLSK